MGCWGMGMAQTDEFCEIYDKFMEEYDNGKPVAEITAAILAEYHAEFDDEDGVMHDVYFALAKAEWMCCEQSELVLRRVREIIESGANDNFYRELEADESDLKVRRRNLDKFLQTLSVPREKPRKRKRSAPAEEKVFPPMEIGDCFAYKFDGGYRVMCILERFKPNGKKEHISIVIFNRIYSLAEAKGTDFLREEVGHVFAITAEEFPGASTIKKIAQVAVTLPKRSDGLGAAAFMYGTKGTFRMDISQPMGVSLAELLHQCEGNPRELFDGLTVGGCYAYPYKDGYKFAVVLDDHALDGTEYRLIAVLSAFSKHPDVDFLNTRISSLTMYDKDSLPNLRDWVKVDSVDVPKNMQIKCFGKSRYIISGIFDFFEDRASLRIENSAFPTLAPLFAVCKDNEREAFDRLEVGGCYAFAANGGYKIVTVLDRFDHNGADHVLLTVLWRTFHAPGVDYMNEGVSHIGVYSAETLPNIDGWALCGRIELPVSIKDHIDKYKAITTESVMKFFAAPPYHSGALTLSRFLQVYFPDRE